MNTTIKTAVVELTSNNPEIAQAYAKANAERAIRRDIQSLSRQAQKEALVEILLSLGDNMPIADTQPVLKRAYVKKGPKVAKKTQDAFKPLPGSKTEKLVNSLQSVPELPIHELVAAVYGADSEIYRSRIYSLLASLKSRGVVKQVKHGHWMAIATVTQK